MGNRIEIFTDIIWSIVGIMWIVDLGFWKSIVLSLAILTIIIRGKQIRLLGGQSK